MSRSIGAISTRFLMLAIAVLAAVALCAPMAWAGEGQVMDADGQESADLVGTQSDESGEASDDNAEVVVPGDAAQADASVQDAQEEAPEQPAAGEGEDPASEQQVEEPVAEPVTSGATDVEPAVAETPVPAQPEAAVQEQPAQATPTATAHPASATVKKPAKRAATTTGTSSDPAPKADPARTIENGVYWIASSENAKQAIVVAKKSKKAGASTLLEKKAKGEPNQKWRFTWKNGYYEIVNLNSGKVLAVDSKKSGANVVQAKRDNTEKQRWSVTRSKDGKSFIIKNAWSGKVLNLNGSAAAGTAITALKANAKASQAFVLKKSGVIDTGAYQLSTLLNKKFVLYAPKAKKGTQVAIAKKKSTKLNQRFYVRAEAGGKYSIQSVATGLFIADVKGKAVLMPWSNSDKSLLWDCTYAAALQFLNASTGKAMLVSGSKAESKAPVATGAAGSGKAKKWSYLSKPLIATSTYAIKGANGNALEVANGSYAKGANVRTAAKASASGSNCFEVQAEGKYFRLLNTKTYQAVAVKGSSYKKAGANVVQVPVASKKAQLWKATIGRDGAITFVNAKSKMALQVSGKDGNVNQGKTASSKAQAFTLKPMKRYSLSGNMTLDKNVATILSAYTSLRSCFSYVTHFSYREGARFYSGPHYLSEATTISYANDMVAHHSGNCYRFASLFSWLARGLGYSSKVANGHVPSASGGLAPHGWTWIYTNDGTYICDPDLNHEMPGHNWYMTTVGGAPTSYGYW